MPIMITISGLFKKILAPAHEVGHILMEQVLDLLFTAGKQCGDLNKTNHFLEKLRLLAAFYLNRGRGLHCMVCPQRLFP